MKETLIEQLNDIKNLAELNNLKANYLGKKGVITELLSNLSTLSIEEKKVEGKRINELKNELNSLFESKLESIENEIRQKKLQEESIDINLPSFNIPIGSPNILEKLLEEIEEFMMSLGFDVVEGPELEKDLYNFELLNLPIGHSARDAQDTFYTKGEELLLRSQTSPVQIRTMLSYDEKQPIRIICPGKTYRRDEDDATHSHQFTQIEGLLVDKDVSLANLKHIFDLIANKLFGDVETRFRPSYYPFTEPSVELDISCFNCNKVGCNVCKKTGWITVGGAGMVHPNVLKNCGYNPEIWKGFAFGFGAERLAMLKYNINDIRVFYNNDLRNIKTFDKGEV